MERNAFKNRKGKKFYINWTPGEKRGNGAKAVVGKILAENFTEFVKDGFRYSRSPTQVE